MPTLFRRKPTEPVEETVTSVTESSADELANVTKSGYTPAKGKATPKRSEAQRRKAEPPPANRREAYKRMRGKQKSERAEAMAGMRAGDERYLMARDKGAERGLVRDVIDSRRTVGTWFFGTAFIVLIGTSTGNPTFVFATQLVWFTIALAAVVDTVLICRKINKLVKERFPKSTVSKRSLYFYAFMRSITFRRLRMPQARLKIGDPLL